MTSLAPYDIALYAALLWVVGIFLIATISGYSVKRYGRQRASWWLFIPVAFGIVSFMSGPAGLALLIRRATSCMDDYASIGLTAVSGIAAYWFSCIVVQFAQNVAYRNVGAPEQRIRFIGGKSHGSHGIDEDVSE